MNRRRLLCLALVGVGLLQMLGWVIGNEAVRGLGWATAASPLPLVFTHVRGYETFAGEFTLELHRPDGGERIDLTPEVYGRMRGPYNRRNVYGAVFAYGPALDRPSERRLVERIVQRGLCRDPEFTAGEPLQAITIEVRSKTAGAPTEPWILHVECEVDHAA